VTLEELAEVGQVAMLHDIGKIGVLDSILRKPGQLDADEGPLMRRPPETQIARQRSEPERSADRDHRGATGVHGVDELGVADAVKVSAAMPR
jgi:hypothetical protein